MSEPIEHGFDDRDAPLSTADLAGAHIEPQADASPEPPAQPDPEERTFESRATEAQAPIAAQAPVFPTGEADALRRQWDTIQAGFVDEPRRAVMDADHLVAATMQRLAESFAEERSKLEGQWGRGDDVSTEALRIALQRYRSFFGRLLSA